MLLADLNQSTLELYNEFNHTDRQEDLLANLWLPLNGEQRIQISLRSAPERRIDALTILSEGHIRCLGLAILLAKALSIGAPLIVFDDAINAIDHDHRSGIRQAVFDADRFAQTQIIVTCHSPEFVKDIQNNVPQARRQTEVQNFVLMHHDGNYQPRVQPDAGSTAYLTRANDAINRFDSRDALAHCRRSLEMLSQKTWAWMESHRHGDIAPKVEGPDKEPQLRGLCEAIRNKLTRLPFFDHPSKQPLIDNLGTILGISETNLVWILLNKGTHEEPNRDDFDRQHVNTVLATLTAIDALELRRGR